MNLRHPCDGDTTTQRHYSRPITEGMTFEAKLLVMIHVFHLVTK